jgi:hypothetical protein
VRDRAIILGMKRKKPGERVTKMREREDAGRFLALRRKASRWTEDNLEALRTARPALPEGLNDRAQDNWEPLLAIADLAGGDWPKAARDAALKLSADTEAEASSLTTQLLADIKAAFETAGTFRMTSGELADLELGRVRQDRQAAHAKEARQPAPGLAAVRGRRQDHLAARTVPAAVHGGAMMTARRRARRKSAAAIRRARSELINLCRAGSRRSIGSPRPRKRFSGAPSTAPSCKSGSTPQPVRLARRGHDEAPPSPAAEAAARITCGGIGTVVPTTHVECRVQALMASFDRLQRETRDTIRFAAACSANRDAPSRLHGVFRPAAGGEPVSGG